MQSISSSYCSILAVVHAWPIESRDHCDNRTDYNLKSSASFKQAILYVLNSPSTASLDGWINTTLRATSMSCLSEEVT